MLEMCLGNVYNAQCVNALCIRLCFLLKQRLHANVATLRISHTAARISRKGSLIPQPSPAISKLTRINAPSTNHVQENGTNLLKEVCLDLGCLQLNIFDCVDTLPDCNGKIQLILIWLLDGHLTKLLLEGRQRVGVLDGVEVIYLFTVTTLLFSAGHG